MHYYIGLDNGGTTTKAALFSSTGEEIAVCSMSTAMLTPQPTMLSATWRRCGKRTAP